MPDPVRASTARRNLTTLFKILLGAGLLWLLYEKGILDPARILDALLHRPLWVGLAVLLHGSVFVLLGVRWRYIARSGGLDFTHTVSQKLCFISQFFSTCLPGNGAGDLVKGVLLSRTGIPFSEVLATMAVDRVAGMAGLFLSWNGCMIAVAILHPATRIILIPVLPFTIPVAMALVASLLATAPLSRLAGRLARRAPRAGLWGRLSRHVDAMLERMSSCTSRSRTILVGLGLSILLQFLFLATALCAARSLSIPLGLLEAGAVLPLASLANAIPISPGGLGLGESAASLAMARLGYPTSAGAELMIVVRMAVLVWALVGGVIYAITPFSPSKDTKA